MYQLPCVYSVSRRHGCKRRSTTAAAASNPASARHGAVTGPQPASRAGAVVSSAPDDHMRLDSNSLESSAASDSLHFHPDEDLPDTFQYLADDDFVMDVDMDLANFPAFSFSPPVQTPSNISSDTYLSSNQRKAGQTPSTSCTTSSTSLNVDNVKLSGFDVSLSAASKALASANQRPNSTSKTTDQSAIEEDHQNSHDCEAYALGLLRSLHHWPLYSPDKYNQPPPEKQTDTLANRNPTDPEALPSLDTILRANKYALSGVVKLLDCSCAQRPHLATLYMAIITKMLSLYELAATAEASSSTSAASSTLTTLQGPRLVRTTIMQVGAFDLDEDDQATLQSGILLRQLKKMEAAIEESASMGTEAGKADGTEQTSVRQWHNMAMSMIKIELRRIYQDCKERLLIIT